MIIILRSARTTLEDRVRIAFVGKGGSGKTTAAALFSRHLADRGHRVLAVDADINQHLGPALGAAGSAPRPLGADLPWLKDHLRGDNPRIPGPQAIIKTTPPGRGSRLVDLDPAGELLARFAGTAGGVPYLVTGEFDAADIGVSCYHSKTGAVELWLNHLVDGPGEYVVVDMTAGADAFASGLFTRFDLTVLVSEPTRRGVGVHRQYAGHAAGHRVALRVLGNKVTGPGDVDYLRTQLGDALIGWLGQSAWVRAAERGAPAPLAELEPENRAVLDALRAELDVRDRDWAAYHRGTVEFHLRNAAAWGDQAVGADLAAQVDPDFVPGRPVPA
jgi:CO dehydrogenase maturation factor